MRYLLRIGDNWVHVLFSFFRVDALLMCCPLYGLTPPPPLLSRNIYYLVEVEGELTFGTIISDASVAIISFSEDVNVRGNYWLLFPHRTDDDELHTAEILDSDVGHIKFEIHLDSHIGRMTTCRVQSPLFYDFAVPCCEIAPHARSHTTIFMGSCNGES